MSSPEKATIAEHFGADHIVDYRKEDVVSRVKALTNGRGVDKIIEVDLGANLANDVDIVAPHAIIASYSSSRVREPVLPYYKLAPNDVTIRFVQGMILTETCRSDASRLVAELMHRNTLRHPRTVAFEFNDCAAAHEAVERGVVGKVIVKSPNS